MMYGNQRPIGQPMMYQQQQQKPMMYPNQRPIGQQYYNNNMNGMNFNQQQSNLKF